MHLTEDVMFVCCRQVREQHKKSQGDNQKDESFRDAEKSKRKEEQKSTVAKHKVRTNFLFKDKYMTKQVRKVLTIMECSLTLSARVRI